MVDNYAICSTVALLTKNLKILCKILIQESLTRKKTHYAWTHFALLTHEMTTSCTLRTLRVSAEKLKFKFRKNSLVTASKLKRRYLRNIVNE